MAEDTRPFIERAADAFQAQAEQVKITEEIITLLGKGFSIQEILDKGYSVGDLRQAGVSTDAILNIGVSSTEIITSAPTGYTRLQQPDESFFSKNKTIIIIAGIIFLVLMFFNNR